MLFQGKTDSSIQRRASSYLLTIVFSVLILCSAELENDLKNHPRHKLFTNKRDMNVIEICEMSTFGCISQIVEYIKKRFAAIDLFYKNRTLNTTYIT